MVEDLAKRERVPARIAKGELDGKMKCRVWKKLHREEAERFHQAYELMGKNPHLGLQEAFGVIQSGLPVDDFLKRRARSKKKEEVKIARGSVKGEGVDAFLGKLKTSGDELIVVLAERTLLDVLLDVKAVALVLKSHGDLEKLQVVAVTRRANWDAISSALERDPKLSQKPAPVAREPVRRPVSDPRPFMPLVGKPVKIALRNGLTVKLPLREVGPFDVVVGEDEEKAFFIPLHAMMSWEAA
ncbi:MAG: hypothetical protein QM723_36215 [Myxococcaceae bacterium]